MSERLSDSMRDRIARAVFESDFPHKDWADESESYRDEWRKNADALLAAFPWLADEPTDEMVEQAAEAVNRLDWSQLEHGEAPSNDEIARAVLSAVFGSEGSTT